jgi:hypothetical protein
MQSDLSAVANWFLTRLIFDPEDGGGTGYKALYPRRFMTISHSGIRDRLLTVNCIVLFSTASRMTPPCTRPPGQWIQGFFPGAKLPGRKVDHSLPLSVDVKTVQLNRHFSTYLHCLIKRRQISLYLNYTRYRIPSPCHYVFGVAAILLCRRSCRMRRVSKIIHSATN